jgi:hypothetical protein
MQIRINHGNKQTYLKEGSKVRHDLFGEGEVIQTPNWKLKIDQIYVRFYSGFKRVSIHALTFVGELEEITDDVIKEVEDVVSIAKTVVRFVKKWWRKLFKKRK